MFVRDRMSTPVVTISPDMAYPRALQMMQEQALHHLPVVVRNDELVGIVTERDLLLAATHHMQTALEIEDIMQRKVIIARPDMALAEATLLMLKHKIGCLPVVDGNKHVIGIMTETDIFEAFVELLGERQAV